MAIRLLGLTSARVDNGGCAVSGGVAISCGLTAVASGDVSATGGLQLFAGRAVIGAGLRVSSDGMHVDDGMTVIAGGTTVRGPATVSDMGVDVTDHTTFRDGWDVFGGLALVDTGMRVADGVALTNGRTFATDQTP